MRATWTTMALALAMAAPVVADDHAQARGGSSGSSSSSAGERHHSSPPSSGGDVGSQSSSSSSGGGSWSAAERGPVTDAQRRHPRPGTGTGDRWVRGRLDGSSYRSPYYGYRTYYGGYSYDPFWYGYWGYSPWYYGGSYGYYDRYSGYGYAPYRGYGRDQGALRIIVDPEKARVYVDGYYAGIADDFDGIFQRLYLPPGRHEVTLKLDGYQTHRFRVYVPYDQTIKIHHVMVRGSGESEDVVGSPLDDDRTRDADLSRDRDRDADRYRGRDREADRQWRREAPAPMEDDRDNADAGTLRLDVRPQDASVYVDGQFRGSGRQVERLRLAVGQHRVEVVRPGYRTVERDVEVRAGETRDLEVELTK